MRRTLLNDKNVPVLVTLGLFVVMFGWGSVAYPNFFTLRVFLDLFIDNAYLLILGAGMTFVIISGGIDLSVGSMLGLATMLTSSLLGKSHWNPLLVILVVLLIGSAFGFFHGCLIQFFGLPPFIITLAGLYLARGLCYVVDINTIAITNPFFRTAAHYEIRILSWVPAKLLSWLGLSEEIREAFVSPSVVIAIVVVLLAAYVLRFTKFGRATYAIGGNEESALLMGLPVGRTKIAIYTLSGFCSALAGIVFTFYMLSGYALHGKGMELDAIASVVIGGTLLTGGVGSIFGTVLGVLVYGAIQVLIMFQGNLNSWWTRIAIGFLVFVFCSVQRLFEAKKGPTVTRSTSREPASTAGGGVAGVGT